MGTWREVIGFDEKVCDCFKLESCNLADVYIKVDCFDSPYLNSNNVHLIDRNSSWNVHEAQTNIHRINSSGQSYVLMHMCIFFKYKYNVMKVLDNNWCTFCSIFNDKKKNI